MAKRNSAGSSGNRRGSRPSSGKSFSTRGKSSDKPFKKSDSRSSSAPKDEGDSSSRYKRKSPTGRGNSADKPFKKFDKPDSKKSSFDKEERSSSSSRERKSSTSRGKSTDKPFKKFDRKDSKSTYSARGKRDERGSGSSNDDRRSSSKKTSGNKSFHKGKGDNLRNTFSKDSDTSSQEERPVARPRSSAKPTFKREEEKSERNSKSFSRSPRTSADRPNKKFDAPSSPDGDSEKKRSEFSNGDRKEKSFSSKAYTKRPSKREVDEKTVSDPDKIRLNRYIANSGLCSRREADEFIIMGLVTVNGKVVTELGHKVNRTDEVRYEDKVLRAEKPVYILMNKPKGYLTTTKDPRERNTVMQILGSTVKERVYPVGRLDRNTTGLLLLTNDGDLADKLMHPSYNVKKIYKVELDKAITKADFKKIQEGVHLEEGRAVVDDLAIISDDGKTVGVELHIGWNRVVRRIFESLQYDVVKLDRSLYAGLDKKDLPRGHWRFLKKEEIILLKHYK